MSTSQYGTRSGHCTPSEICSVCYITFSQVVDTLSTVYTKGTVAFWTLINFFVHIMLVVSKTTTTNKKQASKHTKPR